MTPSDSLPSPSEIVAQQVVDRFVSESLLTVELATKIRDKVATGKMRTEDWKLIFEEALDLQKRQSEQSC